MNLTTLHGDCLIELRKLPAASVHSVITSPPYWGLRAYPIPPSVWGGRARCAHLWGVEIPCVAQKPQGGLKDAADRGQPRAKKRETNRDTDGLTARPTSKGAFCQKCGAWRGQLGLEPSPELYVDHMVEIFEEVRRVLRPDGTLWLNLGDCYHTGHSGAGRQGTLNAQRVSRTHTQPNLKSGLKIEGRKPGDLIGIPWLVAFALQRAGWYLRKDNIWAKSSCMPESLSGWRWEKHRIKDGRAPKKSKTPSGWDTDPNSSHREEKTGRYRGEEQTQVKWKDCPGCAKCSPHGGLVLRRGSWRCTTAHEYFFQFSKSEDYYCDGEAAKEPVSGTAHSRGSGLNPKAVSNGTRVPGPVPRANAEFSAHLTGMVMTRNKRSVWNVNPKPYKGSHTATFPPELIRPIVLASTAPWVCGSCGAPHAPVVKRGKTNLAQQQACGGDRNGEYHGQDTKDRGDGSQAASEVKARILEGMVEREVIGYRPTCRCQTTDRRRAVVMDIFGGTGTVGEVAIEEGRDAVLIEIGDEYLPQLHRRTTNLQANLLQGHKPERRKAKPNGAPRRRDHNPHRHQVELSLEQQTTQKQ